MRQRLASRLGTALLGTVLLGTFLVAACAAPLAGAPLSAPASQAPLQRERARWVPVPWAELPGYSEDQVAEAWPAWLRSCDKPAPAWNAVCRRARQAGPLDEAGVRAWLAAHLQPYRVEDLSGRGEGLATGYYEPLLEASRQPWGPYQVPLYAPPPDLQARRPYWTRQQIDTLPAAQAALRPWALAYVADALDALALQIQGSGRVRMVEPAGAAETPWLRLAYAGHNHQPYQSVGRWLIEQGELKSAEAGWPAIRAWAQLNPQRVQALTWANPRVVFFREEALPDPQVGPRGAQGVPLTPGRSIAVDPLAIPYGTPVWLDTTEPLSARPLRRLTMAQDTGSAIVGAVRADYFWGWGEQAQQQAGRMRQSLKLWVLWPRADPAGAAAAPR
jgi:membrane-bound lytic murein transglycosylase A